MDRDIAILGSGSATLGSGSATWGQTPPGGVRPHLRLRAPGARSPTRLSFRTAVLEGPTRPARSRPSHRDAGPRQLALRPQRQLSVADRAGEADALVDQLLADPPAADGRIDEQEAQLRDAIRPCRRRRPSRPGRRPGRRSRRAHATDRGAARTPRRSARRAPRSPYEAVLAGVERAVALHDPAVLARKRRAQHERRAFAPVGEQLLDRGHGCEHTCLGLERQALEQRRGLLRRAPVELRVRVMPGRCE